MYVFHLYLSQAAAALVINKKNVNDFTLNGCVDQHIRNMSCDTSVYAVFLVTVVTNDSLCVFEHDSFSSFYSHITNELFDL